MPRYIVRHQRVDEAKVHRARELRRRPTPEEQVLWEALRNNRLRGLHFRRQQIIDGFIVDFYCHGAGLVVEVDGVGHARQAEYDQERDRILAARGLQIMRVSNDDVNTGLAAALERIGARASSLLQAASGADRPSSGHS